MGPFRTYLDYIGPIQISLIEPRNYKGYPRVPSDTYKVHYRDLYGQPWPYQAKITYSGQNKAI